MNVEPLTAPDDVDWAAQLMCSSEPWLTLRRDSAACRTALQHPAKEPHLIRVDGARAGFLILDMNSWLSGYIQTICLAEHARGKGIGSRALAWAEERIFRDSPNVFMCVSSFNTAAQRLYARLGYETVGTLKSYIVAEHDELLLRKTRGSWEWFRRRENQR